MKRLIFGLIVGFVALASAEWRTPPPVPTGRVLVVLKEGAAPAVPSLLAAAPLRAVVGSSDRYVATAGDPARAEALAASFRGMPGVRAAYPVYRYMTRKRAFSPNDLYYLPGSGTPGQWYLQNGVIPGNDIAPRNAWQRDIVGSGVTVGIVDDGVDATTPDLIPNRNAADSMGFGTDTSPNPAEWEWHGTVMAGLVAARGGNGIGLTGVAPFAQWASLRIPMDLPTDEWAAAIGYRNDRIRVKTHSYGIVGSFVPIDAVRDAVASSAAAGTIHVWAAGNQRGLTDEDVAKYALEGSPDVITVAGITSRGKFSPYSNFGASVLVCAPSDGGESDDQPLLSTDRLAQNGYNGSEALTDRNYTLLAGGTSVSAALVSGALALALEAQPNLNVRFAKHLLVRTARPMDLSDATPSSNGGWRTNAAGLSFNPNYGFGMVSAGNLALAALDYSGVTNLVTTTVPPQQVDRQIPDNDANGTSFIFSVTDTTPVEEMLVSLTINHAYRGDVTATLTSPTGMTSRLFSPSAQDGDTLINWTFTTNAFWGENPRGNWTLKVLDTAAGQTGSVASYSVRLRQGSLVAAPALASVTVGSTVPSGTTASGTVTLAAPAPAGGVRVQLTSNSSSAAVPKWLTIPAGQSSAPFTITTQTVENSSVATVTARGRNAVQTDFTVEPIRLSGMSASPTSLVEGQATTVTVNLSGKAPTGGAVVALSSSLPSLPVPASVTVPAGASSVTFRATAGARTTLQNAVLTGTFRSASQTCTVPVRPTSVLSVTLASSAVQGGTATSLTVKIANPAPVGGIVVALQRVGTAASLPASVTIPANTSGLRVNVATTVVSAATNVTLSGSARGTSKSAVLRVNPLPVALTSISVSPTTLIGTRPGSVTVTLSMNAPAGGALVTLRSSNAVVRVPTSVRVPAGTRSYRFAITTAAVNGNVPATVTATYNGVSKSAACTVVPLTLKAIVPAIAFLKGGTPSSAVAQLNAPAPAGGMLIQLYSSNPALRVPATVTIPAGSSALRFAITTTRVSGRTPVTITGSKWPVSKTALITLLP